MFWATTGGRRGNLVLTILILASSAALWGCGKEQPSDVAAPAVPRGETVDLSTVPFYRFWTSPAPGEPEQKVRRSFEHKEALYLPPDAVVRQLNSDSDGMLRLGEILDEVSPDGAAHFGIQMASLNGEVVEIVPVSYDPDDRIAALADRSASGIAMAQSVQVTVLPIVPQPSEFNSPPLSIPASASLRFSVSLAEQSRDPLTVRVDATVSGIRTTLFQEELPASSKDSWRTVDVPLAAAQGERVVLSLVAEHAGEDAPAFANVVWADAYVYRQEPLADDSPKWNVLMVSLDTLRADRLGLYGYDRGTSPNLDELGAESVVFERCYAPTSWTLPSHAAAFTGLHPATHPRHPKVFEFKVGHGARFIAEYARDAGYLTVGITEGLLVGADFGFAQGYGSYSEWVGEEPLLRSAVEDTFERARAWMDTHRAVPFFMFLHTYEVHVPYSPPEPYRSRFYQGELDKLVPGVNVTTDEEREACESLYLGEVAYTDAVLGKLIDWLRSAGLLDRTLVVVFSDHGEEFLDHGELGHGFTIYNEVLHVPLLLRFPGESRLTGRVARPVGLTDLFATLVDFIRVTPESVNDSQSLLGLTGWPTTAPPYSRTLVTSQLKQLPNKYMLVGAQDARHKYIAAGNLADTSTPLHEFGELMRRQTPLELELLNIAGTNAPVVFPPVLDPQRGTDYAVREMLYDLSEDPFERTAIDAPQAAADLRDALRQELERVLSGAPDPSGSGEVSITERQREELEAVGYL